MWNNGGLPEANYITGPNYLSNGGYRTVLVSISKNYVREPLGSLTWH